MNLRTLRIAIAALASLPAVGALQAAPPAPAALSGKVFLDANANGRLDPGEPPLAGIRVTDGVNFASSAPDGSYTLPIGEDYMIPYRPARTVSVCWPTGKWPTGRWWHRLSDVADPKAVHFGLRDDAQKLPFVFLHASDDHGIGRMYTEHYANDVRYMPAARFLFNTGDMGYATPQGADEMFRSIASHQAAFPIPMFITPGNHDFVGEEGNVKMDSHPLAGWGAQTKYLGPVRWSFDYAGVHFIGLDYMEKTPKGYEDRIPHVAVAFMEKDLASVPKGTRVVLLVHCYDASADFFQALHKFRVDYVCCGHTHQPNYARLAGVPSHTNYGTATGVVTAEAIDVAERRPITYGPSILLGYFKGVTMPAMEKRRQRQHSLAGKTLANQTHAIAGAPAAESVEIAVEITPGTAKKIGFRAGLTDAIEITFDGQSVNVAGAPVPFCLIPKDVPLPPLPWAPNSPPRKIPADTTLRWRLLIDKDRLSILANDTFRMTKAVKVDQPANLTLLAEGGQGTFTKVDLWELRPIANRASRGLHHFDPPAWNWGTSQHVAACLDDKSKVAEEILKRYNEDGVINYDNE